MGKEGGNVEAFRDGVGGIPTVGGFLGGVKDVARLGARRQNGLRRLHRVAPARLVAVGPDQHGLAGQWRPVSLVDRGIGAVHRGSRHDAGINQGLRAFLAFDQHHLCGAEHPRLVVERAWFGRCHLVPLNVPGAELLLLTGWVIAVDDGDKLAGRIEVVPLGGGWAQFIDGHGLPFAFASRRGTRTPEQIGGGIEHTREIMGHVNPEVISDQRVHIATGIVGAIGPQSRLLTIEHHLEAIAGAAQHIADQEFAPAFLACREQGEQHRFQPCEKFRSQFLTFGIADDARGVFRRRGGIVEVDHSASSTAASVSSAGRPCTAVLRAAHAESSDRR